MNLGIELFLPNRKTLQDLYVPLESELAGGDARCQVFDFGYPNDPQGGVNPFDTRERVWVFDRDMIVWGLTGTMVLNAAPGTVVAAGFRFQIFQKSTVKDPSTGQPKSVTRSWFNKHQIQQNVLGTGGLPFLLRKTQLCAAGDAITVEVKSLVTAAAGQVTRIQVCLFGVVLDTAMGTSPGLVSTSAQMPGK
jgi:hypothetical protein